MLFVNRLSNLRQPGTIYIYQILIGLMFMLAGCNAKEIGYQPQDNNASQLSSNHLEVFKPTPVAISSKTIESEELGNVSSSFYHTLVAELYLQSDNNLQATHHYVQAAENSDEIKLLKSSVVMAARAGQSKKALSIAKRWVKNDSTSLEAKQYLALLLLRNDQFDKSADALNSIKLFVEKDTNNEIDKHSKSENKVEKKPITKVVNSVANKAAPHQFITQLLKMESHSNQALKAYKTYLNKYGEADLTSDTSSVPFDIQHFQKMSLATLAMKAKQYKEVPAILENIQTEDAALIGSKALHQLGRNSEAVKLLRPYINKKETVDSVRFEYIRFLILSDQKDEATRILNKLVIKYPDNKDLLKSLVALNLDQKRWDEAETYAKQLMFFKDYKSDAHHFLGEIFQARGDNKKALEAYLQVVDGKLINSAQSRIPELLGSQEGLSVARLWLHQQRTKLTKQSSEQQSEVKNLPTAQKLQSKKKASLYKIEADLLFSEETYDTAMQFYQRALVLDPENNDIRYSRGMVYEQQGLINLAEKDFLHILKFDRNDSSTLNALGYMLAVHTKRLDEAHLLINKAYKINPKDTAIIDSLGWVHFKRGEMDRAEHYLRIAYKDNKEPEIASHLIEVLNKKGQNQEAKSILLQMLRKFPNNKMLKQVARGMKDS